MITTKNNFKGYLRRKYPNIQAYPIYGLPVYILDQPMNDMDAWTYNQQQLPNGKYVVFIGVSIAEATKLLTRLKEEEIPQNGRPRERETAPTTFSCFEAWLDRHQVKYINRTFCSNQSPEECFHHSNILGCETPQKKGTWYMYELPGYVDNGERFVNIPHVIVDYGEQGNIIVVLIKASSSVYKSKKQRFIEKFQLMQPIYEQLIKVLTTADISGLEESEDWNRAQELCRQYMETQFDRSGTVNKEDMKEAWRNGTIGFFVRDLANLHFENTETF